MWEVWGVLIYSLLRNEDGIRRAALKHSLNLVSGREVPCIRLLSSML